MQYSVVRLAGSASLQELPGRPPLLVTPELGSGVLEGRSQPSLPSSGITLSTGRQQWETAPDSVLFRLPTSGAASSTLRQQQQLLTFAAMGADQEQGLETNAETDEDAQCWDLVRLVEQPSDPLVAALSGHDDWQVDSFHLNRITNGRPLSTLAFFLMTKMDVVRRLRLDEMKLARFLRRIEDGYPDNPYHSRIHAADVLCRFHVILTRCGVLDAVVSSAQGANDKGHELASSAPGYAVSHAENLFTAKLLACYLAAIVHDYEHRGVNNEFLIRTGDPLALLYNDSSPQENHHVAATFVLLAQEQYAFFPWVSKRLKDILRKDIIELVLATDMKQHFSMTGIFTSKVTPPCHHSNSSVFHSAVMSSLANVVQQDGDVPFSSRASERSTTVSGSSHSAAAVQASGRSFHSSIGRSTLGRSTLGCGSTGPFASAVSAAARAALAAASPPSNDGPARAMSDLWRSQASAEIQALRLSSDGTDATSELRACNTGFLSIMKSDHKSGGSNTQLPQLPLSWDSETQMLVLKMALKCADLGHLTSSKEVHKQWVARLEEEMFRQGDQERALGQPVSPLMDRTKGGVTKSQTGFFNIVAFPMYRAFAKVFPAATHMVDNLVVNYNMWSELEGKAPAKPPQIQSQSQPPSPSAHAAASTSAAHGDVAATASSSSDAPRPGC